MRLRLNATQLRFTYTRLTQPTTKMADSTMQNTRLDFPNYSLSDIASVNHRFQENHGYATG